MRCASNRSVSSGVAAVTLPDSSAATNSACQPVTETRGRSSCVKDRQDSAVRRDLQTALRLGIEEQVADTSGDDLLHMPGVALGGLSLLLVALASPTLIRKIDRHC